MLEVSPDEQWAITETVQDREHAGEKQVSGNVRKH